MHQGYAEQPRDDEEGRRESTALLALILNWFRAQCSISRGVAEGYHGIVKMATTEAYGLRSARGIDFALFHAMGRLPEPEYPREIC